MNFFMAIGASVVVSLVSLAGVTALLLSERGLKKMLLPMVGLGAGGLIGGAFAHLLPEALRRGGGLDGIMARVILGFCFFFVMEKFLYWRHCHKAECEVHPPFTYLNLIGDALHNLIDGLIIGASFFVTPELGIASTLAIILHEVPQELGDFAVLIHGGFSPGKALFFNFLSALTAVVGAAGGYVFSSHANAFVSGLLPFAAGGFIYVGACDLIPQLHRQPDVREAALSMALFILGVLAMMFLKAIIY